MYTPRLPKNCQFKLFAAIISLLLLPAFSLPTHAVLDDDIFPAGRIDKPEITFLKLKCNGLQANEENSVKLIFKFADKKANLQGGLLTLLITEDTGSEHQYSFNLEHKKFSKEKGRFKFKIELSLGNCKNISIRAQLQDSLKIKSKAKNMEMSVSGADNGGGGGNGGDGPWGTQVGEKAVNFTLLDQDGNQVNLHDYAGKVILLDFSTMWCGPCMQEASDAEEFYQEYKDQGFIIITVLLQDYGGGSVSIDECKTWSNTYGLSIPVLADTNMVAWNQYDDEGYIPLNLIIDRDMVIQHKQTGFSRQYFEQIVVGLLNK